VRQPVRSGTAARSPATSGERAAPGRNLGAAAVLALQGRIGNAALGRVLARDPKKPDPGGKKDPLEGYRPAIPAPLNLPKQWQNPHLLKTVYPGRDAMFREFVVLYREIELGGAPAAGVRKKIREETDAMSGDALSAEVKRVMGMKSVPDWIKDQIWDYAGMRYWQNPKTDAGRHGAHTTYYSPARLMFLIRREMGDWTRARADEKKAADERYAREKAEWDKKPSSTAAERRARGPAPTKPPREIKQSKQEQAWLEISDDNAMARLIQMREGKGGTPIPDWVWHQIVRLTPLRSRYAGADWEDLSKEKPDPEQTFWIKVMTAWKSGERTGKNYGGGTQWRPETLDDFSQVASAMVCNEISEATQVKRGIRLPGGIRLNAEYFAKAAADGAKPGASPEIAGSYFKPLESAAELRPGASVFWINSVWMTPKQGKQFDNSNMVFPIPGVELPMPFPTEHVAEWSEWDKRRQAKEKWDKERARLTWNPKAKDHSREPTEKEEAKLGPDPGEAGDEPTYDRTTLPADDEEIDGWTYTVRAGEGIAREKDGVKQWMTWRHQATVLKAMGDGRVYLFETRLLDPKDLDSGVTGINQRYLGGKDLRAPWAWIGYIPGKVDAGAARP
jgi:hypothetical protein